MNKKLIYSAALFSAVALSSCSNDDDSDSSNNSNVSSQDFKVTIENVSAAKKYFLNGIFNTPVGESMPGPATPGNSYSFDFDAAPGHYLSFATMYVASNDLFYGPDENGIALYNNGTPKTGDITSEVLLWDAGTEVNEMPGTGSNQPMNQSGANTGPDENGTVREISMVNDGFTYPSVASTIRVMLTHNGGTSFTATIENLSGSTSPLAPGVFVVHTDPKPLYADNVADYGWGLEALAEDGNAGELNDYNADNSGVVSPLAPGVWAVHDQGVYALFTTNEADLGEGLEGLAEDGDPAALGTALSSKSGVTSSGVFNTPDGASAPGPLLPGGKYEFTFSAKKGDYLNFATMFVQSNDLFYGPNQGGIALWNGDNPIDGDITSEIELWDVGTEANEFPGTGLNQPPRQSGANTGADENGTVKVVDDGFMYPANESVIKVTVSKK